MKTNFKFIYGLIALSIISSCSPDHLETTPTEFVSEEAATANAQSLFNIVNGIHRSLYNRYESQGQGGLGAIMIENDALGEDVVMTTAGNGWYNTSYQWVAHRNAFSSNTEYPYRLFYRIIRNANTVILNIDKASGDVQLKNNAKAQSLFYRAFSNFYLVQYYGKRFDASSTNTNLGIPLRLDIGLEPLPRATVAQVYEQINKDIDEAITAMQSSSFVPANKSHISLKTIYGLKARVALTQQNWAVASTYAKLAKQGFTLMNAEEYRSGFNKLGTNEWMWGSAVKEDQSEFFANFGAYMSRNFNSTNIRTNPKAINRLLYNKMTASDVRRSLVAVNGVHVLPPGYSIPSNFSIRPYTSAKFLSVSSADSRMDIPYMRASEMYLIEAEAEAQLGNRAAAAAALFTLASTRDPNYTLSVNTGAALITEILWQRRMELWGEGFRFFDLKRTNSNLDRSGSNHSTTLMGETNLIPAGDIKWQWLIPIDEINATSGLVVQNE